MVNCYPPGHSPIDPGTGKGYCASYNYTWIGPTDKRITAFADSGLGYGCGGSCAIARSGFCTRWGVGGKCYGDPGGPVRPQDPKCTKDCYAAPFLENIQCHFDKMFVANCGGSEFTGAGAIDWFLPIVIGGGLILLVLLMKR